MTSASRQVAERRVEEEMLHYFVRQFIEFLEESQVEKICEYCSLMVSLTKELMSQLMSHVMKKHNSQIEPLLRMFFTSEQVAKSHGEEDRDSNDASTTSDAFNASASRQVAKRPVKEGTFNHSGMRIIKFLIESELDITCDYCELADLLLCPFNCHFMIEHKNLCEPRC